MNLGNMIVCLLFILPMMGCDWFDSEENKQKEGLGCFARKMMIVPVVNAKILLAQRTELTVPQMKIAHVVLVFSNNATSCIRTCDTAEDCYDQEQCSIGTVKNESMEHLIMYVHP